MRLFALRGANSVEGNDAEAILDATDALMRELMERNALAPEAMVSCIFTLTDDLDAEFPAVAARRLGLDRVPLLCAREVPVPGLAAAGDPRARALLRRGRPRAAPCLPGRGPGAAGRPRVGTMRRRRRMAIEFAERIRRIPVLSAGLRLRPGRRRGDAGLQRVLLRAAPGGGRGRPRRRWPAPTAIRIRPTRALRRALSDRYGVPRQRIALGNGSCDLLLAAGEALLEPGAEVVYAWPAFSVYPHLAAASGARAIQVPLDSEDRHDLDAMAAEITVATRLVLICNPNNPTSTSLPLEAIEAFLERVPAPRLRDPRRGLLRVRADPRRHLRLARAAAPPSEPGAAADLLQGLRAGRAAGRLRAVRLRGLPGRRRPGPPAVLPQRRRPGRRRRGAAPSGRGRAPRRRAPSPRAWSWPRVCAARPVGGRVRRQLRLDCTCPRTRSRPRSSPGCASAGVLVRAGAVARPRAARCGSPSGTEAENARFLAALARAGRPEPCSGRVAADEPTACQRRRRLVQRAAAHDRPRPDRHAAHRRAFGWSFYARFYAWRFS